MAGKDFVEAVDDADSDASAFSGFTFSSGQAKAAMDLDVQADDALLIQQVSILPQGFEVEGRPLSDIAVPSDRLRFRQGINHVLENGGIARLLLRLDMGDSPHALIGIAKLAGEYPIGVSGLFFESENSLYGNDVDEASLYRELFERLPFAVYFKDADARYIRANNNFVRSAGFTHQKDVIGKTWSSIFAGPEGSTLPHGDEEVIRSGQPMVGMTELESYADGESKVVHSSRYPIRSRSGEVVGTMGFSHDVTQSARVVEALHRSEQRYALAAQASRDGIWDLSVEDETFEFSARMCELLGLPDTREPIPEEDAYLNFRPEDRERFRREFAKLLTGEINTIEQTASIKVDGRKVWIEVIGTALKVDGEVVRFIGSAADITEDREREAELEILARHDPLTGLYNRRVLLEKVDEVLDERIPATLLALDLDYFKVINDSLGHQAGDEVLCEVASRLKSVSGSGHLGRLGGDEFALLLTGDDHTLAEEIAAKMTDEVRGELTVSGLDLFTTASIGIVKLSDEYNDANQAFRDADIALYAAKKNGKSRYEVFEPELRDAADNELDRQVMVRRAVQENDFFLMYQPVFETNTQAINGAEALLRLTREDGTVEAPPAFLPYLEQSELIAEVGEWVIYTALSDLAAWKADGLIDGDFRIGINVSRKQFLLPGLADCILEGIDAYNLSGDELMIEVTETAVVNDQDLLGNTLERLRSHGIKVALDDFGTGQSSLSVLHEMPVDILKIDKSFIDRVHDKNGRSITQAALWLANSLGLETIAEGVEEAPQFEWLQENGCDMVQGYLLGEPMLEEEIRTMFVRLGQILRPVPDLEDEVETTADDAWATLEIAKMNRPTLAEWAELVTGRKAA